MRVLWALCLVGCAAGEPNSDTGLALCDEPPVLTWENFGHGLMVERCQSCHSSSSVRRNGAPETVSFDTHDETLEHADRILQRVVIDQTMPPQGGIDAEDLQRVRIWLECWEGVE